MDEVKTRGLDAVMADATAIALSGTVAAGISIDLDAIDPIDVPAVGSPEPGGMSIAAVSSALLQLATQPRILGCEIVEFNPDLPGSIETAWVIEDLLHSLYGGQL